MLNPTQPYVYGWFAGHEQLLSERNVTQNLTILSGEIGDLTLKSDNAWHVVTIGSGALTSGATVLLDGFTVRDGYAAGTGSSNDSRGAGLFTRGNVLTTLQNMTFVENHAPLLKTVPFAASTGLGGAIYHINGALSCR